MRSVFVLACLFAAVLCAKTVTVSLTIHDDDSYKFEHGHVSGATAWAHYEESYEEIGWQKLHLRTNHKDSDEQQARAAGMLEAHLTHGDIVTFYRNAVESNPVMFDNSCPALQKYIEDSYNHLTAEALSQGDTNPEWGMVMLYLEQLNSMGTQYRRDMVAGEPSISDLDFYRMNMAGEGDDLVPYLCPNNAPQNADEEDARYGHCTGAVRVAPGNAELFIGQDTWSSYSSMNRILKRYSFGYQRATVGDVSFSSYPATLFSMDDFYTTGAKLAILETTFVIFAAQRAELYTHDNMNPLATVPTWMRAMVANTLAQNGEEWTAIFAKYNSGTYNNQWLVVDYKLFTPGKALESNTVWMLEQLPGHIHRMDNTPLLRSNKWIPSVNAPSYAPFHKLAGYDDQTPYWQYHGPRYHIFSERMGNVKTMADFKGFMRYNDYKHDANQNGDPGQAISSRYDIRPDNIPGHSAICFGGIDSKVADSKLVAVMGFDAVAGPTTANGNPPFVWSTSTVCAHNPHRGMPDKMQWEWTSFTGHKGHHTSNFWDEVIAVIVVVLGLVLLLGVCFVIVVGLAMVVKTIQAKLKARKDAVRKDIEKYEEL